MRQISERLDIHYTPKHGSWLNMAGIESGWWLGNPWNAAFPTSVRAAPATAAAWGWLRTWPPPAR